MINIQAAVEASRMRRDPNQEPALVKGSVVKSERFLESFKGEHDKRRERLVMGSSQLFSSDIDVSWLPAASGSYNISDDPRDYVLVEVPLVTVDIPNRNLQAFPYEEVSYFDPLYGRMIYSTFIGKPTHIDHDNKDPLKAKGVNFDASLRYVPKYNVWKIFVLSGYDRTKDPDLAKQILNKDRTGYSMGALVENFVPIYAESLVSTSRGLVQVADFSSEDEVDSGNRISKAKGVVYQGTLPARRVTLSNGMNLTLADNHPLLVLRPDLTMEWVQADQVKASDYVAASNREVEFPEKLLLDYSPIHDEIEDGYIACRECGHKAKNLSPHLRHTHSIAPLDYKKHYNVRVLNAAKHLEHKYPTEMTPELAKLLGYFVSEGSFGESDAMVGFINSCRDLWDDYNRSFKACFGIESKVETSVFPMGIKDFFNYLGVNISRSKTKSAPWSILQAPRESVVAFLQSFWEGDGSARAIPGAVTYHSTSKELMEQVQLLLARLGIVSDIEVKPQRTSFLKESDPDLMMYAVRIFGKNVDKFRDVIGSISTSRKRDLKNLDVSYRQDIQPGEHIPYLKEICDTLYDDNHKGSGWYNTNAGVQHLHMHRLDLKDNSTLAYGHFDKWDSLLPSIGELDAELAERISMLLASRYSWVKVTSNNELGIDLPMYCVVDVEDGSFVANGLVTHNCSISGQVDTNVKPSRYSKGETFQGKLAYQLCVGVNFIENSSVEDPADITAETEAFWT